MLLLNFVFVFQNETWPAGGNHQTKKKIIDDDSTSWTFLELASLLTFVIVTQKIAKTNFDNLQAQVPVV